ncbi:MAG: MBL fold metallo-hydrolase [Oscillospiraceae bacterium]|nr:MBL fold metallo-hydrolase [Oscillospiraceae bacterium]
MLKNYTISELDSGLYQIKDPMDVLMYLVVGEKKALLFDTGYGIIDLPAVVKSITDKPLTVVLGHGHIDHANGAYQFDEVYLREPDYELCNEHTSPEIRSSIIERMKEAGITPDFDEGKWINSGKCNLKPLEPGTVFDLGGINVEIVDMAGHTGGSIGILLREKRILIDSDSANSHCWMFMPQSLSVRAYAAMLERVMEMDFDVFYVAHQDYAHTKKDMEKFIKVAKNVTLDKCKPYDNWVDLKPLVYTEGDVSIVVNERTLA